jgi:hypothetical protein
VEGNRYDASVAAEIITAKRGYHLPIYRQQDWFGGSGWMPSRGTLLNIEASAAELIRPFVRYLREEALGSGAIGTDETRVTLLLPSEIPPPIAGDAKSRRIHEVFSEARQEGKPSVSARMWAYRSLTVPLNIFDLTVSRHRDGPDAFLVETNFTGTLLPSQFLAMYRELYDIEDRAKQMSDEERLALRQQAARPVWERMRQLLDSEAVERVLPKDKFAEALGYLRNQWDALQVSLGFGFVVFCSVGSMSVRPFGRDAAS